MVFDFRFGIQEINYEHVNINRREAVRAIIIKDGNILMMHCNKGDYKLPGGGIKIDESHEEALIREVREETGYTIYKISKRLGIVFERKLDEFEEDSIFEMISYYYICEVLENQMQQELDDYEAELDFRPQWVNIDTAINNNESVLKKANTKINSWVMRETSVLRELKSIIV